jgi:hypothetical protein
MKSIPSKKAIKVVCIVMQGVLLTACAVSFAVMSEWGKSQEVAADLNGEDYLSPPTDDTADDVIDVNDGEPTRINGDVTASVTRTAPLYKADVKAPLETRVGQLMQAAGVAKDGVVDFGELTRGKVDWREPYVLIRFDELAYILLETLKTDSPKVKGAALTEARAKMEGNKVTLEMDVRFEVTNKLIKFVMGSGKQNATVSISAEVADGGIKVRDVTVVGNKKYSDGMVKLGSDFLFGTEDYKGYIARFAETVSGNLGRVYRTDGERYGVIFANDTMAQ